MADWLTGITRFLGGIADVFTDAGKEFVKDVTGGDIDLKNAPKPQYTGKGVTVERTGTDRTQASKRVTPQQKFMLDMQNGCQDIDKYVAQYMQSVNPKNRAEAAAAISAIMPLVNTEYRLNASDVNIAFDNYLSEHFPVK